MSFEFLSFLESPYFVMLWYGVGILLALWFIYYVKTNDPEIDLSLRLAWPILFVFFSVIGFAFYKLTCGSKQASDLSKQRRTINAASHCVAGDGIGIMTAMVISRLMGLSFWPEFWFEYAMGFVSGWFIFQYLSMRNMNPPKTALWKAGRAEFFSMLTVMTGMGLVMRFVTPAVVGERPLPDTAVFWGFAMLGLLVGFICTYPMNLWMVKIGWKHGKCRM